MEKQVMIRCKSIQRDERGKAEEVVLETLFDPRNSYYPDVVVVVTEVENLKRNLLLFTQAKAIARKPVHAPAPQQEAVGQGGR